MYSNVLAFSITGLLFAIILLVLMQNTLFITIPEDSQAQAQPTKTNKTTTIPLARVVTKILYDDERAHKVGWDPNSRANTFLINESRVNPLSSTIIVNTHQEGMVICATDFITYKFFEVSWNKAPSEGAQLHYTVINVQPPLQPPSPSISKEIEARYKNVSKDILMGPLPPLVETTQTDIPILSQN